MHMLKPSVPMWVFRSMAPKNVIKVKCCHKGGTLIQQDWYPYKKERRQELGAHAYNPSYLWGWDQGGSWFNSSLGKWVY
jgi:hypothetical protein